MSTNTSSPESRDVISLLYGLRAGLSEISIEADRLRTAKEKLSGLTEKLENKKRELQNEQKAIAEDMRQRRELDGREAKKQKRTAELRKGGKAMLIAAAVMLGIALLLSGVMLIFPAVSVILVLSILGAALLAILGAIQLYKAKKSELLKFSDEDIAHINESIAQRSKTIGEKSSFITSLEGEIKRFLPIYERTVKECCDKAKRLHDTLLDTYGSTLDAKDWQNIDHIICLLETGKADSIDTALRMLASGIDTNMDIQITLLKKSSKSSKALTLDTDFIINYIEAQ